ncbi:MAG: aminotransferase class V-fold PLP-dependent enzyme [Oscillospiraceae bacterium]|nr:aminotransferase class V-fold PLP-dependent enzyme [Oscillospiraceae bacterium]
MQVYFDNAATTKLSARARESMLRVSDDIFGNPSSLHAFGQAASSELQRARETVARCLNAAPREIYFTSGGTEADNQAIFTCAEIGAAKGKKHIVSTAIEHHAVLHCLEQLEKERGFRITLLPVDESGVIKLQDLEAAVCDETCLVTVMFANNEIGTIQPVEAVGRFCRGKKIPFHCDAVQAVGHVPVDVKALSIDYLSLSGHKFHGPKGVGALYARQGMPLRSLLLGGAQERNRRAGTENLPAIAGMAAALEEAVSELGEVGPRLTGYREKLINGLLNVQRSHLNGDRARRLPGNVNFCFEGLEGESLLLLLDHRGVAASSGSACTSGSLDPSHVLLALGRPHEIAHGSLRLTLSRYTTQEEVDYTLAVIPAVVDYLRDISPVWERIMREEQEKAQ